MNNKFKPIFFDMLLFSTETFNHSYRVSQVAKVLAEYLDIDKDKAEIAGMYHDVGKLSIPENILHSNHKLTDQEREIINKHSIFGQEILETLKDEDMSMYITAQYVSKNHHRRFNEIDKEEMNNENYKINALITALDIFDALRSKRSYKKEMSREMTKEILTSERGNLLDIEIADFILINFDRIADLFDNLNTSIITQIADIYNRMSKITIDIKEEDYIYKKTISKQKKVIKKIMKI